MSQNSFSRRYFFCGALLGGAVPRGGFGSAASLKALGYKPVNEKLNLAGVGVAGRGWDDLNGCSSENIVALCDVDSRQAARTFNLFAKAARYSDFRRMLDKEAKNIDAVVIATPDHLHATVALACMKRELHVYVEKPLTRTPWEAHLLTAAAAKYKVATQMGNQGYSHEAHRVACEIFWSGEIGNVTEVHATTSAPSWPQGLQSIPAEEPVPQGLDWDLWLGGSAARPYTSGGWDKDHVPDGRSSPGGFYLPFNWRGFYDFGSGSLGDWGIHTLGTANMALQLGMPIAVECVRADAAQQVHVPREVRPALRFSGARQDAPGIGLLVRRGERREPAVPIPPQGFGERDDPAGRGQSGGARQAGPGNQQRTRGRPGRTKRGPGWRARRPRSQCRASGQRR